MARNNSIFFTNQTQSKMVCLKQNTTILALGAHPDDIELGAGGFLHRIQKSYNADIYFGIMTHGLLPWQQEEYFDKDSREKEALESMATLLEISKEEAFTRLQFGCFPDMELANQGHKPIKFIESLIRKWNPDIILSHSSGDRHEDHRVTYHATVSAARDFKGSVLFYQAPSTVPNEFHPTFFVNLDKATLDKKMTSLQHHISQRGKVFLSFEKVAGQASAWALFHRMQGEAYLEAFEGYQSFYM